MKKVAFIIPGRIGGWQRAGRDTRRGAGFSFTPKKTRSDQGIVKLFAQQAMHAARLDLLEGPLLVDVALYQRFPKSYSARQRAHSCWITGKPDCDNLLKNLLDAMNGIIYSDDAQVSSAHITRKHRAEGVEEIHVHVEELTVPLPPMTRRQKKLLKAPPC
jgi:Holliday junction resolvase RusA-like endonuclease